MAGKGGYDWGAIMAGSAARRAARWIGRELEGAPSPQAPIEREENARMMAVWQRELDANENNVDAMMGVAYHLIYIGEHMEAILLLDRAIALEPGSRTLHERRGTALLELGLYADALDAFVRARSCYPAPTDGFDMGIAHALLGNKAEASRIINASIMRNPERARQGMVYSNARRALEIHGPDLT